MSIKLMSQVWEKEFSHSEQAVLLAMADYAGDDGRNCYPSYDRVAWKTGYSTRQVQRIIKGLVAKGILIIVKPSTQHQSTHYWIRLDRAKDKPAFRVDILDTQGRQNVQSDDIQGRHLEHPGWTNETSRVDMVSTDPLVTTNKAAAACVSPSETDADKDGRFTLQLVRDTNLFAYYPADAKTKAARIEDTYSTADIRTAVAILVERHHAKVHKEGKGVHNPVDYLLTILTNEARPKQAKRQGDPDALYFITDPVTGERKEVSL